MNDLSIVILTNFKFLTQFEWWEFSEKMRKNEILKLMFCVEGKVLRTCSVVRVRFWEFGVV